MREEKRETVSLNGWWLHARRLLLAQCWAEKARRTRWGRGGGKCFWVLLRFVSVTNLVAARHEVSALVELITLRTEDIRTISSVSF